MPNIQISIQGQELTATPDKLLVSRSVGEVTFAATFDDSWADYEITIIFAAPHIQKSVLYTGGQMDVPWEVLDRPTDSLRISAVGIKDGHRRPTAHMRHGLAVVPNGKIAGGPPEEYSPALWEQVLARLDDVGTGGGGGSSAGAEAAQAKAEEAQKKAEAAQTAAEAAAQAAEASNLAAAQEAAKAAGEAGNAAKFAGSATGSAEAAAQSATSAGQSAANAEAAKEAAETIKRAIPIPLPGDGDNGKIPVARDGFYVLEDLAIGGGSGEAEIITDATLQEAAAYTWQGAGAAAIYRRIIIDIACTAQEANINTGNAAIYGNTIATYYINAATKDNRKTTIELEIINSSIAIFRRSCMGTRTEDPMTPVTYIAVTDQLIVTSAIDVSKPLLRIPAELPAGTRVRILGVKA